ncbi:cell division protein FtsB [Deinococcus sp. YIM 134068]|uniref:cell division protein FtsB n=1 Tax=Deinococcus lichenicola TaxID=3118910 RepID=UPI002F930225
MTAPDPPPPNATRGLRAQWRQVRRLPFTLMITCLLAGLGIVQLTFQLGNLAYRTVTWTGETRDSEARIRALERDVRVLREAAAAAQDPSYLEQLARCQGFVGVEEEVIVAVGAPETPGENCAVRRLP